LRLGKRLYIVRKIKRDSVVRPRIIYSMSCRRFSERIIATMELDRPRSFNRYWRITDLDCRVCRLLWQSETVVQVLPLANIFTATALYRIRPLKVLPLPRRSFFF